MKDYFDLMPDISTMVNSPCIKNCCLNKHDICLGCFRSLDEIKLWTQVDDQQRRQFLIQAEQRKKAALDEE